MVKLVQPLFISRMMTYFDGTGNINTALLYGGLICLGATFNAVIHHPYFLHIAKLGVKMRLACSGLVYKKVKFILCLNMRQNIKWPFLHKKINKKRFPNWTRPTLMIKLAVKSSTCWQMMVHASNIPFIFCHIYL